MTTEKVCQRSHSGVWLTLAAPPTLDNPCERTSNPIYTEHPIQSIYIKEESMCVCLFVFWFFYARPHRWTYDDQIWHSDGLAQEAANAVKIVLKFKLDF
ncbi:hypothetical protein AVEN_103384-1 [Araneus ventricosus]|uniref:Uncharacterized protein n=1 Tax=Araneus ventricosus TaxID=182803 RepID=A0A4Y2QCT4_ARAVE|nr:hypothetical protein AVEN_103384-1 [Araneus ventricosus]